MNNLPADINVFAGNPKLNLENNCISLKLEGILLFEHILVSEKKNRSLQPK